MAKYTYPCTIRQDNGSFSISFPDFPGVKISASSLSSLLSLGRAVLTAKILESQDILPLASDIFEVAGSNVFHTVIDCDTDTMLAELSLYEDFSVQDIIDYINSTFTEEATPEEADILPSQTSQDDVPPVNIISEPEIPEDVDAVESTPEPVKEISDDDLFSFDAEFLGSGSSSKPDGLFSVDEKPTETQESAKEDDFESQMLAELNPVASVPTPQPEEKKLAEPSEDKLANESNKKQESSQKNNKHQKYHPQNQQKKFNNKPNHDSRSGEEKAEKAGEPGKSEENKVSDNPKKTEFVPQNSGQVSNPAPVDKNKPSDSDTDKNQSPDKPGEQKSKKYYNNRYRPYRPYKKNKNFDNNQKQNNNQN